MVHPPGVHLSALQSWIYQKYKWNIQLHRHSVLPGPVLSWWRRPQPVVVVVAVAAGGSAISRFPNFWFLCIISNLFSVCGEEANNPLLCNQHHTFHQQPVSNGYDRAC